MNLQNLAFKKMFENGKLYESGKINVVVLKGNYYEMGRQYGELLKDEIREFYEATIEGKIINNNLSTFEQLKGFIGKMAWSGYPQRQKEIFRGMSQTSGLSVEQVVLLDQNVTIVHILMGAPGTPQALDACSFIAAWADYTKDGKVVCGRNLDWLPALKDYARYLTVVVFNPTDGSNSVATVIYAGMVGIISGINDKGLFVEMNDGTATMGNVGYANRAACFTEMLNFLLDADTMDCLDTMINSTRTNCPIILNVADADVSYSYESAPHDTRRRSANPPGLLASTNQYLLPSWGTIPMPDLALSLERYHNLMVLGNKYKGTIDVEVMKKIMDAPLFEEDGSLGVGATMFYRHIKGNFKYPTVHQIITSPANKKIWVKVPEYNDWTPVDLELLFSKS